MFDFIFEFVGEIVGDAVFEGSCALISGTVLGLADWDNRPVSLGVNSRVDNPELAKNHQPRRGGTA